MNEDENTIRDYFLGTLPVAKAEEIELRLVSDAEFEAVVIAAENDLVEDRLDGQLSDAEARNFNENYLITPARVKNIETVALLRRYAKSKARTAIVASHDEDAGESIFDKIRNIFSGIPAYGYAAGVLLIVAAAVGYIWLGLGATGGRLQAEYASLNRQDLSDLEPYRNLPQIIATSGSLRGSDPNVKLTGIGGSVFARLALADFKDEKTITVTLLRQETVLLTFDSIRVYDINGNREIRLLLPSNLLERGTYQINVAPSERTGSAVSYGFKVE